MLPPAGVDFISFAGMHLICTMFITTDSPGGAAGVFHKVLDPSGHAALLEEVDRVLGQPVGDTTLRQYLRSKRNKLAVHGTLEYCSQPKDVQAVAFYDDALEQFDDAIEALDVAVDRLDRDLAKLESESPP